MSSGLVPQGWIERPDVPAVAFACLALAWMVGNSLRRANKGWATAAAVAAVVVPLAYADAVAEAVAGRLGESLSQGRVVRARQQATILASLRPWAVMHGMPLPRLLAELDTACVALERQIRAAFPGAPAAVPVRQRVVALLQLERPAEALLLLEELGPGDDPVVLDFVGLCHQRLDQPQASLAAYRRGWQAWLQQAPGPRQQAGLANAAKGIAYAHRQLDQRAEEEAAYEQLVRLEASPTNLLLLARCYQDHGKTGAAVDALNRLLETTDDQRLRTRVHGMLATMRRDHFGCLRVPGPDEQPGTVQLQPSAAGANGASSYSRLREQQPR